MRMGWVAASVLLVACKQDAPPQKLTVHAPEPLPVVAPGANGSQPPTGAASLHEVGRLVPFGRPTPHEATRVVLTASGGVKAPGATQALQPDSPEGRAWLEKSAGAGPLLLEPEDEDVFLAQVTPVLAVLETLNATLFFRHPDAPELSLPFTLKDEKAFGAWLDEVTPGRLRVIQRADGFELQTAVGKLPGKDPNGPSVPTRGGQLDLPLLRSGLELLAGRFRETEALGFVPSYGTALVKIARAMGTNYTAPDSPLFDAVFLVYPRPITYDGGRPNVRP